MPTLRELLRQRRALDQLIADYHQRERPAALASARALAAEYDLTAEQVFGTSTPKKSRSQLGRYLDLKSGNTWDGTGAPPRWLGTMKRLY